MISKINSTILLISFIATGLFGQAPNFQWVKQLGSTNNEYISSGHGIQKNGNLIFTGLFESSSFDVDPGPGTHFLYKDSLKDNYFIAILDSEANFISVSQFYDTHYFSERGLRVDFSDNLYSYGSFKGTEDFDPGSNIYNLSAQFRNPFILKLDPNGNFLWAKQFSGGIDEGWFYSLAIHQNGDILVTGEVGPSIDLDPGPGIATLPVQSDFLVKYDSSMNLLWLNQFGDYTQGGQVKNSISSFDFSENSYFGGDFQGSIDIDPGPGIQLITSENYNDVFIVKMNKNGSYIWGKQFKSKIQMTISNMIIDKSKNVITTGDFKGKTDFNPDTLSDFYITAPSTGGDLYTVKLDSMGILLWAKAFQIVNPGSSAKYGKICDIAERENGNILIAGWHEGSLDLDPGVGQFVVNEIGLAYGFLVELDSNGAFIWGSQLEGPSLSVSRDIFLEKNNNLIIGGNFEGIVDFNPGTGINNLTTAGESDIFLLKLKYPFTNPQGLQSFENTISFYPNPTTKNITFHLTNDFDLKKVLLYNDLGIQYYADWNLEGSIVKLFLPETTGLYNITLIDQSGHKLNFKAIKY